MRTLIHLGSLPQVHPTRKFFAVGEKGYEPDILIFEYPSLKLYRICKLGTETAYAYLSFSPKGIIRVPKVSPAFFEIKY